MSKNNKKKKKQTNDSLSFIKDVIETNVVSRKEIETLSQIDHPLFSFKYLKDISIDKCQDSSFFHNFLIRLQKLSELGWEQIRLSQRHSFGMEKIPVDEIVPRAQLPDFVTKEGDVDVFRAVGDNRVFVGLQEGKIFYIFFIEASFGDVCPH
jgi:hypothetical protein